MMKNKFYFLFLSLAFISIAYTAFASSNSAREAIPAVNAEWAKAYNAGNAAGVSALYTDDAKLLPPNSDFVSGREAIAAVWQGLLDAGGKTVKLDMMELTPMGDTAVEVGTYDVMDAQGKAMDHGKYIVQWKKAGTTWKLHRDIWNSSMPAAPTAK
jgi:uncharacterized protein (TIGR02246 family)